MTSDIERYKKLLKSVNEAINPKHKYVKASIDLHPHPDDTEQDMEDHIYKHGGDSLQVTKFRHNVKGTNGASEVHFNGEPHHVMKLINHHYDEKYPENMEGYKKYRKDYHGDEGQSVKESVEITKSQLDEDFEQWYKSLNEASTMGSNTTTKGMLKQAFRAGIASRKAN